MIVVAIVGILTSVALPNFIRMNVRSKTSERALVMTAILRGIEDIYRRNGSVVLDGNNRNPASPGLNKQVLNASLSADWTQILNAVQIEGAVYYGYSFRAWEGASPGAWIFVEGDLDGDGAFSNVLLTCERKSGVYQCTQDPLPGFEDQTTF
jgi:type II secretory pathway pseudopilin PulG